MLPLYGIAIPEGYRGWELIAPAREDAPFDELRVVLGKPVVVYDILLRDKSLCSFHRRAEVMLLANVAQS